jgi:hypothetical protein
MKAVRAPIEPADLLEKVDGTRAGLRVETVWAKMIRRRMRAADMLVPDRVLGLAWSGAMTAERVRGIVEHLPDGLTEIYAHPATGPYIGSAAGYDYRGELEALTDNLTKTIIAGERVELGRFVDFA